MKNILSVIWMVLIMCMGVSQLSAKVWYVGTWPEKPSGDIKTTITDAITAAAAGDQVWIAKGVYELTEIISLKDGVSLYGGFSGSESALDKRVKKAGGAPWEFVNETILKGDISFIILNQSANFSKSLTIDGLTVTQGKQGIVFGFNSSNTLISNCIVRENGKVGTGDGGGIAVKSSCIVENCLVEKNQGKNGGGIASNSGSPIIRNCVVRENNVASGNNNPTGTPQGWGGGIFNNGGIVQNCIIENNKAISGGGLFIRTPSARAHNCLIVNNSAIYCGGITFDGRGSNTEKAKSLYNLIIANNQSTNGSYAGGVHFNQDGQELVNSILWQNKTNGSAWNISRTANKTYAVNNCVLQDHSETEFGTNNVVVTDSTLIFAENWLPATNSPCVDKGIIVSGLPATDLAGEMRIMGKTIDIGAYETVVEYKPDGDHFYVNQEATGKEDGSSWENAFTSIQKAISITKSYNDINKASIKIWVKAGEYALSSTIAPETGTVLYGSFAGTEKTVDDRALAASGEPWDFANPTILKGNNSFRLLHTTTADKVVVDGFVFTGGKSSGSGDDNTAGGAVHSKMALDVQNCVFRENESIGHGGGLCLRGSGSVKNCLFENNKAATGGGVSFYTGTATTMESSVVRNNTAKTAGGIYLYRGQVINCKIIENVSTGEAGGIYIRNNNDNNYIVGCVIAKNKANKGGGLCYHSATKKTYIYNSTIVENSVTGTGAAGGGIHYLGTNLSSYELTNNIFWGNKSGEGLNQFSKENDKMTYCAVQAESATGEGNIALGDDATILFDLEYCPVAKSVCIDAGKNGLTNLPGLDIAGNPRVAKTIDMGAYEYNPAAGVKPDAKHIFYVKAGATGDGSSWNKACDSFEKAILGATTYKIENPTLRPQVWVAEGTYLLESTQMLYAGINVFGGFAGTETSPDQRVKIEKGKPWEYKSQTILDGQGKFRIFELAENMSKDTLSGFVIQNGKAESGGGLFCPNDRELSILENCLFKNCQATGDGGALRLYQKGLVIGCRFENCSAGGFGGAVVGMHYATAVKIWNCEFEQNKAEKRGGAIYLRGGGEVVSCLVKNNTCVGLADVNYGGGGGISCQSGTTIRNSMIVGNQANRGGGVMGAYESTSYGIDLNIVNCHIVNNTVTEKGAGVFRHSAHSSAGQHKKMIITNTLFWNNKLNGLISHLQTFKPETDELKNCAIHGEGKEPEGVRSGMVELKDSISNFAEDFRLKETSVCVDNALSVIGLPDFDIYGGKRLSGLALDIGACEFQTNFNYKPSADGIVYVKTVGNPSTPEGEGGYSWEHPITEIAYAIQTAKSYKDKNPNKTCQIWIAAGSYVVKTAIPLYEGISIYGGFAGTESQLTERQMVTDGKPWEFINQSIIDAEGQSGVFAQSNHYGKYNAVLDGLTIQNGLSANGGGVMLLSYGIVQNCRITNCKATGNGGGVHLVANSAYTSRAKITNCHISNCQAKDGGAIQINGYLAYADIENCLLENNEATNSGGAIFAQGGNSKINGCVIRNNTATERGGGVYVRVAQVIQNSLFVGNQAKTGGGLCTMYDNSSSVDIYVVNNTFVRNAATDSGNDFASMATSTKKVIWLCNNIFWKNLGKVSGLSFVAGMEHQLDNNAFEQMVYGNDQIKVQNSVTLTDDSTKIFGQDYTMIEHSLCVDKGKTDIKNLPSTDILGSKRTSNGKTDIGAYEYQNPGDDYKLDYVAEKMTYLPDNTKELEYSYVADFSVTNTLSDLIVEKDTIIYVRRKDVGARGVKINLPGRGVPTAKINFATEKWIEVGVGSTWNPNGTEFVELITDESLSTIADQGEKKVTVKQSAIAEKSFATLKEFTIPKRLEKPTAYSIDYEKELLDGGVVQGMEASVGEAYSVLSDSIITHFIPKDSDKTLSIRWKATETNFASAIETMNLPKRPEKPLFSVDFVKIQTKEIVSATVEYDTTATFVTKQNGLNAVLDLTPGKQYRFRTAASNVNKNFASETCTLNLPVRPEMSSVVINFLEEKLVGLPKGAVWDYDDVTAEAVTEDLSALIPTHGERTLRIYVNVSDSTFASDPYDLIVPARPQAPQNVKMNYRMEQINSEAEHLEWKKGEEPFESFRPQNISDLIPTENSLTLKVRVKATEEFFASQDTTFVFLPRPDPIETVFSIDYVKEQTFEPVQNDWEYSIDSLTWTMGENAVITLTPGNIHYFRVAPSEEKGTFASKMNHLTVPIRPQIVLEDMEKMITDSVFTPVLWNSWTNTADAIVLTSDNEKVATVSGQSIRITGIGECTIVASRPALEGVYFAAEETHANLKVVSTSGETSVDEVRVNNLMIADGRSDMTFRIPELQHVEKSLMFFNRSGKMIFQAQSYGDDFNMGKLEAGTYYYVLTYQNGADKKVKKGFVEIVR